MNQHQIVALIFGMPGWGEMLVLALVGLLIFGKRLPDVGRSLGRGILEFKKGLSGIDAEIEPNGNKPHDPPQISTSADVANKSHNP